MLLNTPPLSVILTFPHQKDNADLDRKHIELYGVRLEEKRTEQPACLFFPLDENAFIDGLLAMVPFRRRAALSFFSSLLSFLSPPQPAAGGQLVKSAAVCGVIKIIQVLLGSPGFGGVGGVQG